MRRSSAAISSTPFARRPRARPAGLQPAIDLGELRGGGGGGSRGRFEAAADLLAAAGEVRGQGRPQQVDQAADEDGKVEDAAMGARCFGVLGLGAVAGALGGVRAAAGGPCAGGWP
jgi:hypothetical protein